MFIFKLFVIVFVAIVVFKIFFLSENNLLLWWGIGNKLEIESMSQNSRDTSLCVNNTNNDTLGTW